MMLVGMKDIFFFKTTCTIRSSMMNECNSMYRICDITHMRYSLSISHMRYIAHAIWIGYIAYALLENLNIWRD